MIVDGCSRQVQRVLRNPPPTFVQLVNAEQTPVQLEVVVGLVEVVVSFVEVVVGLVVLEVVLLVVVVIKGISDRYIY